MGAPESPLWANDELVIGRNGAVYVYDNDASVGAYRRAADDPDDAKCWELTDRTGTLLTILERTVDRRLEMSVQKDGQPIGVIEAVRGLFGRNRGTFLVEGDRIGGFKRSGGQAYQVVDGEGTDIGLIMTLPGSDMLDDLHQAAERVREARRSGQVSGPSALVGINSRGPSLQLTRMPTPAPLKTLMLLAPIAVDKAFHLLDGR